MNDIQILCGKERHVGLESFLADDMGVYRTLNLRIFRRGIAALKERSMASDKFILQPFGSLQGNICLSQEKRKPGELTGFLTLPREKGAAAFHHFRSMEPAPIEPVDRCAEKGAEKGGRMCLEPCAGRKTFNRLRQRYFF